MNKTIRKMEKYIKADEIFNIFYKNTDAVFLDSSLDNDKGNYSIIGLNSYLKLMVKKDVLFVNGKESRNTFEKYLREYLHINKEKNETDFPLISGAIGYISYDYGRFNENISTRHTEECDIPECIFNFYDNFIIEDIKNKTIYIIGNGKLKDSQESVKELERHILKSYRVGEDGKKLKNSSIGIEYNIKVDSNFKREEYKKAIDKIIQYIIEGDIYIANMTQQLKIYSEKPPYEVFKYLRKNNPSPFGGYLNYGEFQIISASPERFLKVNNGIVNTRPIKGTRPRGVTQEEDNKFRNELENSQKDKSELLMIVDLERNDLNKVCESGSVTVDELFTIEEYSTVFHLVSDIRGKLKSDLNVADLIKATFPGGSITGAPKIRAMEIIDEIERSSRGIYTGSMGYISLDGNCDLNIIIRTALHKKNEYYLGVGGGITCESDLEFEYEETLQKAKALLEAMK